jgi:hypothetical protein
MTNIFDEQVGLLKEATILSYNPTRGTIKASLTLGNVKVKPTPIEINFPHALYLNNRIVCRS